MNAASRLAGRGRWPATLGIVAILVVAVAFVGLIYSFTSGSDDDGASTTTVPAGGVVLPQNPSLLLQQVDATWYVENDGNVTMFEIEVRSGDSVICELGTLAPDERTPCEAATGSDDLTAFGLGPQDQVVEVGPG